MAKEKTKTQKENKFDEKKYPLKLNQDYYVVSANDLIKGRQKMTLREAQLLYIAMSQVVREDKDFKTYTTTVSELADFMGVDKNSLYRDLYDICKSLMSRVVEIKVDANKWKIFQWISGAEYDNGQLTIRLHDDLKPYLIDLVAHYSQSLLHVLCSFRSYYTCRLYQLLVCEANESSRETKEVWTFTCEELREFFQIEKNQYKRNADLLKKTIIPAIEELNKSDYCYIWDYVELRGHGKGNPIKGVQFSATLFRDKEDKDFYFNRALPFIKEYNSQKNKKDNI